MNIKSNIIDKQIQSFIHLYINTEMINPEKQEVKHKPLIISGCSGAGKGTLINFLLSKYPDLFQLSISLTTRNPRPGQQDGREYYFVTKDQFQKQIQSNVFAQHCEVHGNYYGTHQGKLDEIIAKGKICILDIDLQGGQKIHAKRPDYNFLWIDAPSIQVIQQRLRKRGTQTQQAITKRMKNAKGQLQAVKGLTYYGHLMNYDLPNAKQNIIYMINKTYGLNLSAK